MKLVHNQLPLGERRYRQSPIKEDSLRLCPCCKSQPEHLDHFLRCDCNQGRNAALSKLKSDICTTDIHPVRYLLSAGLVHWLTASPLPFAPSITEFPVHFHDMLNSALASQARIGWHQAVKGYFSKQWSILANLDMHHPTAKDVNKGSSRIRSILRGLFGFTSQIWLARNAHLHAKDDEAVANIRSTENAEICHYHTNPHLLIFADRHLCSRSLNQLLNGSASTRRRWLRRVKDSVSAAQRDGTRQPRITSFFSPNIQ